MQKAKYVNSMNIRRFWLSTIFRNNTSLLVGDPKIPPRQLGGPRILHQSLGAKDLVPLAHFHWMVPYGVDVP